MKRILMTSLVVLLGLTAAPARAASPDPSRTKALETLEDIRQSASPEQHRALGFQKSEELQGATVEAGIPVYMIRLDQLRQYQGEEASRLLVDLKTLVFPVTVAGQPRSLVEVRAENGRWETARVGGANKVRILHGVRQQAAKANGMANSDFFEVRIPALNMLFLGHHDAEGLKLTPLIDDAAHDLKAGRAEPAEKVLARLVAQARATPDTLP